MTELTHMEAIRLLSGIFVDNPGEMQTRLVMVNLIARNDLGLADDSFTDQQCLKAGIKLKRPQKDPISDPPKKP